MDHRGLWARLAGASCTPCGAAVPVDRIAILADRGAIAFVELVCPACGSRTTSIVLAADHGSAGQDTAAHPEHDPATVARLAGATALAEADVVEMRRFLAGWNGDLRALLAGDDPRRTRASGGTP